jgi:hypothetical protein
MTETDAERYRKQAEDWTKLAEADEERRAKFWPAQN